MPGSVQRWAACHELFRHDAYRFTLPAPASTAACAHPKLATALARIAHNELVLTELQGALDVELTHPRERDGRFVGTLSINDATVRTYCTRRVLEFIRTHISFPGPF